MTTRRDFLKLAGGTALATATLPLTAWLAKAQKPKMGMLGTIKESELPPLPPYRRFKVIHVHGGVVPEGAKHRFATRSFGI